MWLALIGDSITPAWEGNGKEVWDSHYANRGAVNLSIGGGRTEHVIWRLTHGNREQIAAGIERILGILAEQSPDTRVVLHVIVPRGRTPFDEGRLNNTAINDRIRLLADGERVHWLDLEWTVRRPAAKSETCRLQFLIQLGIRG